MLVKIFLFLCYRRCWLKIWEQIGRTSLALSTLNLLLQHLLVRCIRQAFMMAAWLLLRYRSVLLIISIVYFSLFLFISLWGLMSWHVYFSALYYSVVLSLCPGVDLCADVHVDVIVPWSGWQHRQWHQQPSVAAQSLGDFTKRLVCVGEEGCLI